MKLSLVTIGQSPRVDITAELDGYLPTGVEIIEFGALDHLDEAGIAAIAPRAREGHLTSRLRDGGSAVFGHGHTVPLVQRAIRSGEDAGADATVLLCAGDFPGVVHDKPLFLSERLSHDGVRGLLSGLGAGRLGVVRPLPEQLDAGYAHWGRSLGRFPAAMAAASPYTDSLETIAAASAKVADRVDLVVLDCMGFGEDARRAAAEASGVPVVTVRGVALRLLSSLL
ncbi:AroM family protein [Propioniciclava coleopterorum]|uniref:AroM family protein n=1 Tax=Propioniciclava coleopterorum TaxID=2714937 RepID=A0A6G7Y4Q5_9ACTN|nr:AroM family protein [Propioniciclava coleopterorum]QIK71646.1 AroM family protein [Propioniciclava coleopterorum]